MRPSSASVLWACLLVQTVFSAIGGAASTGILQRLAQAHQPDQIEVRGAGSHRVVRRAAPPYTDPKYQRQKWYYSEDPTVDRKAGLPSIRVEGAWAQGVTGRGVFVMVVDDGVDDNPELAGNVDTSKGLNISTGAADSSSPYPVSHGTQVASIIAANDNNGRCGVGVAPDVSISGVVLPFGGEIPDSSEEQALNHRLFEVDIYSNSWGSSEQTTKLGIMGPLAQHAVEKGSMEGRGGKGSIYVWAAGNGGLNMNYCSYDGYIQQQYVIPVTGLHHTGRRLSSTERCSAVMVTTYSRSGSDTVEIVSTHNETGTCPGDVRPGISDSSAATPFVAGAVALALEANDALGWRDIHHLIVESSNSNIDVTPDDWLTNAAGKKVSPTFGFGLLDVERMVANALQWNTVPEQVSCHVTAQGPSRPIPAEISADVYDVMACREIVYLERVQVYVDLNFTFRGHIGLELTSPSGTTSVLLPGRFRDAYNNTLKWTVTSVHFWGEPATKGTNGVWKLNFIRKFGDRMTNVVTSGNLYNWKLSLFGTKVPPTFPVLPTTAPPATPTTPSSTVKATTTPAGTPVPPTSGFSGSTSTVKATTTPVGTPVPPTSGFSDSLPTSTASPTPTQTDKHWSTTVHVDSPEPTTVHVDSPKPTTVHVDSPKPTTVHVDSPKPTISYTITTNVDQANLTTANRDISPDTKHVPRKESKDSISVLIGVCICLAVAVIIVVICCCMYIVCRPMWRRFWLGYGECLPWCACSPCCKESPEGSTSEKVFIAAPGDDRKPTNNVTPPPKVAFPGEKPRGTSPPGPTDPAWESPSYPQAVLPHPCCYVWATDPMDERLRDVTLDLSDRLRRADVPCTLDRSSRSVQDLFGKADQQGVPFVVVMCLDHGMLRERRTKEERIVPAQALPRVLCDLHRGLTNWKELSIRFPLPSPVITTMV